MALKLFFKKKHKFSHVLIYFQVFPNELETQSEYEGFSEWLQTFDLYRGKKSEEELEEENRVVGKFKVGSRVLKILLKIKIILNWADFVQGFIF